MEWAILVQSSKKGTSCTLTLPPSIFPVTLQLGLGSLVPPPPASIPQLGSQGVLGMAGAKAQSKQENIPSTEAVMPSHFLAETLPGRAAWLCNPVSPMHGADKSGLSRPLESTSRLPA